MRAHDVAQDTNEAFLTLSHGLGRLGRQRYPITRVLYRQRQLRYKANALIRFLLSCISCISSAASMWLVVSSSMLDSDCSNPIAASRLICSACGSVSSLVDVMISRMVFLLCCGCFNKRSHLAASFIFLREF
jgi:hypothetical protein